MFTNTILGYLKAIAAFLSTEIAAGFFREHWWSDDNNWIALIVGVIVALTPNVGYSKRVVNRTVE